MTSKRFFSLMTTLLILLFVAACAQPQPAQPTQAPQAKQPTKAPAPTEAPEPTEAPTEPPMEEPTAELLIWADDTRAPALEPLVADFKGGYGVEVTVQQVGFQDIREQVKVAGPAGEGPDIFIGAHDWLGELVVNGLVASIDLGDKRDRFLDAAVNAFNYDGTLYGVPYATENVAFVYNPELVPEPPQTWDAVKALSAQLVEAGEAKSPYTIQTNDPYHFFPIMTAFGGYVFGRTEDGSYDPSDVGIDSEGSIAAAKWLAGMVEVGYIEPGVDYDVLHTLFEQGDAAMIITGPWALPRIRESGIPYAVTKIPAGPAGPARPFLGVQGFMVSAFSDNQLLAETFLLEFVATEETMQRIFEVDPRPSAFLPVREKIEDPDIAGFAEAGVNGMPMPAIPEMSAVWTAWGDAIELIITGQASAEEAFKNAAEQIRTAIEGG